MSKSREETIKEMKSKGYDVLVIGGGVTGACTARDAALRGFTCACVEKNDWAFGTSSRSSKMIHGGIRYLEMFDFKLVFEACRERRQLLLNAPHLVYPQAFTFPIYRGDKNGIFMIESGLLLYDVLALFRNVQNHRMYMHDKAMELEEGLDSDKLKAAGVFYDCSTDDARLTLAFALTAIHDGADCANYLEVVNLLRDGDRLAGAHVRDVLTGEEFDIESRIVVNAAGAWGDEVCELDEPGAPQKLQLTKGSHIIVPRGRARTKNALPIVSPADDRLMFVIPRGHFSLIGTTDTYYHDDLDGGEDVAASKVSREHRIYQGRSGLLTIAGGKLTTARSMAEEMVDMVAMKLLKEFHVKAKRPCQTKNRPILHVPEQDTEARVRALAGKLKYDDDILFGLFKQGTEALNVLALVDEDPSLGERLDPVIPHIKAQIRFAVESEMARSLSDFLVRRTEIYYTAPDQGLGVADEVARMMGDLLGWSPEEGKRQVESYKETVALSRRYATAS